MIDAAFFIEAQGNNKKSVEDSLKGLVQKIKDDPDMKIIRTSFEDIMEEDGSFSQAVEVEIAFTDFNAYIMGVISYAPSAIEVLKPKQVVLKNHEFLATLGEIIRIARTLYEKHRAGFRFPDSGKTAKIGLTEEEISNLQYQGAIRAKIIIETRDRTPEKMMGDFVNIVKEDVFIMDVGSKAVEGDESASVVGINCFMYEIKTLLDIATKLVPVLVEITEPEEIVLSQLDIQDIGVDLSGVIFELSHTL